MSSKSLIQKLNAKYSVKKQNVTLIRNAFDGKIIELDMQRIKQSKIFHLCYVGTVSTWFDFEMIDFVIKKYPNVNVEIIGPVDNLIREKVCSYEGSHVHFHGSIEHDKLYEVIREYDCMIMPFQLNETVLSVDPVKLYEYINYGKNIICIRYDEVEYFKDFVFFYNTKEEISAIVEKLIKDNTLKYSNAQRIDFLKNNSWKNRVQQIEKVMVLG